MNIREAEKSATIKILAGIIVFIAAAITCAISIMLLLYHGLDDGTQFGRTLSYPFKRLVAAAYANTSWLHWLWNIAPVPSLRDILSKGNFGLLFVYICLLVGAGLCSSGTATLRRIRKIKLDIEEQLITESIRGEVVRSREQIVESIQIPESSTLEKAHSLYIAPTIVAIVTGLILKFGLGV